jgi:hypothetical protein
VAYETFDEQPGDRGGGGVRFVVGLVIGALVVGAIWLGQWATSSRDSADSGSRSTTAATSGQDDPEAGEQDTGHTGDEGGASHTDETDQAQSDEPQGDEPQGDALARCEEVFAAQEGPLEAAARSLSQWEIHVGAMNQLVAGTITLPQARRFWEQTRVGAARRLERYDEAMRGWRDRLARCPHPDEMAQAGGVKRCARAVAARTATVRAADTSIETWRRHVHHMEMLRDGEITPEQATQEWLASWHRSDRELAAYAATSGRAASVTC